MMDTPLCAFHLRATCAAVFPSFVTDLSEKYRITPPGRIYVPISDEEATVTYYLICKHEKETEFKALLNIL